MRRTHNKTTHQREKKTYLAHPISKPASQQASKASKQASQPAKQVIVYKCDMYIVQNKKPYNNTYK